MSELLQSTSNLLQLKTPPKKISANTHFTDLSSRLDQQQLNKPIKAFVKAASEQPSVATLASLGIKVRDFAYESKLPPIRPIYRHPRQIQPAVGRAALKRQWTEDDPFYQPSSQPESSQKKLERTSTEPVIPSAPGPPARMLAFTNIDDFYPEHDSLHIDSQQPNVYPQSPVHSQSNFETLGSEPYVDTPLATPKGSLHWPALDTSNNSASQLNTEAQSTTSVPPSFSQLGISDASFSQRPATPSPSPLISAPSLASVDDGISLSKSNISTPPRPPHGKPTTVVDRPIDPTPDVHTPTTSRGLSTRYHLRKRPALPISPFSPTKSSPRLHSLRSHGGVIPPSQPHSVSNQSSHSRGKPKGESSSPSSRTLLRRAVTNGQEKRRRMG